MHDLTGLTRKDLDLLRFCVLSYRLAVLREAQAQRRVDRAYGDNVIGYIGDSSASLEYAQRLQDLADKITSASRPRVSLLQRIVEWVSP